MARFARRKHPWHVPRGTFPGQPLPQMPTRPFTSTCGWPFMDVMGVHRAEDVYWTKDILCFMVSDVFVYVAFYRTYPPEQAWEEHLEIVQRLLPRIHGLLVITQGNLTAKQRARVRLVYHGRRVLFALLTESVLARGALTALHWFGIPVAGFTPGQYREALRWMQREELSETVETRMREVVIPARPKAVEALR